MGRWIRSLVLLGVFALQVSCGGSDPLSNPPPAPPPPPPPPPPAPVVATVEVTPGTSSVLVGVGVALSAVAKDAAGATINGKTFTWSTSSATVATVAQTGQVTTVAPGNATISAAVDGRTGNATVEVVDPANIPFLSRPFAAATNYFLTNFMDHDIPEGFFDNGRKIAFWGEQYDVIGYEGHEGYDWRMAEGTPILAAAAGTVVGLSNPGFFCPLTNQQIPVDGSGLVFIEHNLPGGVRVRTMYAHLSRKDVTLNQQVTTGQQIGLSGNVGCSLNPHLHFQVNRVTQTNNGQVSVIDPYGWEGPGADPWQQNAAGALSTKLWKPGEAPDLLARFAVDFNANGGNLFFGLSAAQPMGVRDNQAPNNEYVEVARDPAFAPANVDIAGATIRTRAGTVYTFPAGAALSAANPTIRVYSGAGTNSASTYYMGRATQAYDNLKECIGVYNAAGQLRNQLPLGVNGCS